MKTAATSAFSQSYVYDPFGRRIRKTHTVVSPASTVTTNYLYDGSDIHAEYQAWSQPQALYAHGQGVDEALARLPLTGGQFDAARYYHSDAQGTLNGVTQQDAAATDTVEGIAGYDPWGVNLFGGGTTPPTTGYGWQGRERDETGLMYFRARYYDPAAISSGTPVGRFVSRDPTGYAGGLNQYAAFDNDPVNLSDPSGTTAISNGLQGLLSQNYYNQIGQQLGLDSFKSSTQSLAAVNYRPSPYQQSTTANVQTALNVASAVPFIGSVAALASAAIDLDAGNYGAATLGVASVIPFVGSIRAAGRTADVLLDVARIERSLPPPTIYENVLNSGIGFNSSRQLRSAMSPGAGEQIHHIVEQNPANIAAFGANAIHNTANAVPLARSTHQDISAFYSRKIPEISGNQTVRNWLKPQSFDQQYEFGMSILKRNGAF